MISNCEHTNHHLQIHLMTFQGTRYCAKDPSLVSPDEIKAARGELDPPEIDNSKQ